MVLMQQNSKKENKIKIKQHNKNKKITQVMVLKINITKQIKITQKDKLLLIYNQNQKIQEHLVMKFKILVKMMIQFNKLTHQMIKKNYKNLKIYKESNLQIAVVQNKIYYKVHNKLKVILLLILLKNNNHKYQIADHHQVKSKLQQILIIKMNLAKNLLKKNYIKILAKNNQIEKDLLNLHQVKNKNVNKSNL